MLKYPYVPELEHDDTWCKKQNINKSCSEYYKDFRKEKNHGDKDILLTGLPKKDELYIRYWAAFPSSHKWNSFRQAYKEKAKKYESMPNKDYANGGIALAKNGRAKLKLSLPQGYRDEDGFFIPPHFHYRLCQNGELGPVHTQFTLKPQKNLVLVHSLC